MSVTPPAQGDLGTCAEKNPKLRRRPNRLTASGSGRMWAGAASPRAIIGFPACTALSRVPLYG